MPRNNAEPKPKFLITANKQTKLSVQIPQKLSDLISEYRNFHKEVSGEEVALDSLVSAFISAAITSDKSFVIWRKAEAEKKAADVAAAQSASVAAETSESRKEVSAEPKNVKNMTKKKTNINLK